jgi:hypothetical protein
MRNLIEQAINSNDGDHAAKMIRDASKATTWPITVSQRNGQPIASSAPTSSLNGCKPRPASLVDDTVVDG